MNTFRRCDFALLMCMLFLTLLMLPSSGCQDNLESSIGKEYVNSQTRVSLIDTFSVKLSTVILDTLVTSRTGSILLGNYEDEVFGSVSSESFFQIGVPESFDVQSDDLYDSLRLVLTYNTYCFGDTNRPQRLLVHQLTGGIEYEDGATITSRVSFSYNTTAIGALTYTPGPNGSSTTVSIPMSDRLGRDLFAQLIGESGTVTDNAAFLKYIPGLLLREDPSYGGNIIGFFASSSAVQLILYTRKAETHEENPITFALQDSSKQFNHIVRNFSGTRLAALSKQRYKLSSESAGGLAFLQGGVGLAIRVDFPTLSEALGMTNRTMLAAKLTLSPQNGSYRASTLPTQMILCQADAVNTPGDELASSALAVDEMYGEGTIYSFDVTSYLRQEFADSYVDPEKGLLIMLPSGELRTQFVRLVGDAHSKNLKLSLYFLSY
jgi:hypothetical protein